MPALRKIDMFTIIVGDVSVVLAKNTVGIIIQSSSSSTEAGTRRHQFRKFNFTLQVLFRSKETEKNQYFQRFSPFSALTLFHRRHFFSYKLK